MFSKKKARGKPDATDAGKPDGAAVPEEDNASQLTRAEVARLVKRQIKEVKGGKPVKKAIAIKEDEVFAFAEYDDHVVVVTTDGRKLRGAKT